MGRDKPRTDDKRTGGGAAVAVAYICDQNYHHMTLYSLASVARSQRSKLDFYLMQSGYTKTLPPSFEKAVGSRGHRISVMSVPAANAFSETNRDNLRYSHISSTMFLKNRVFDLLSDGYDYILYLDSDVLVFNDLHSERVVGFEQIASACVDLSISTGFDDPSFLLNCKRHGVSPYFFNSGVMIINTRKWQATNASERYVANLILHEKGCPYFSTCEPNDQCALNITLGTDLKLLPVTWNVQKSALHTHAWKDALIRHYTGRTKFLPVQLRVCDPREYALLCAISNEFDLPAPNGPYDFGVFYQLNRIRRYQTITKYNRAIAGIIASRSDGA
jgi:lipopolysaccharide biosynthesis glycosyltransferase